MVEQTSSGKGWTITEGAFDTMLSLLDSEREKAGEKYELIRQKLVKFFTWRNCPDPETFTDETIDRVARKLVEGTEVVSSNPYLFFHGIAINVLREHWKKSQRVGMEGIDDLPLSKTPAVDPFEEQRKLEERARTEVNLGCLKQCLASFPGDQVDLLWVYHQGEGGNIRKRQEIAANLGIPLNALRIRMFRLRQRLEECVRSCGASPQEA